MVETWHYDGHLTGFAHSPGLHAIPTVHINGSYRTGTTPAIWLGTNATGEQVSTVDQLARGEPICAVHGDQWSRHSLEFSNGSSPEFVCSAPPGSKVEKGLRTASSVPSRQDLLSGESSRLLGELQLPTRHFVGSFH